MDREINTFNPFLQYTYLTIPNCLAMYPLLSNGAKLCYGRLLQYAGKDGLAFPSHKKLAEQLGRSVSQTKRYISELKKEGFIWIEYPDKEGKKIQMTCKYHFVYHDIFKIDTLLKSTNKVDRIEAVKLSEKSDKDIDDIRKKAHEIKEYYNHLLGDKLPKVILFGAARERNTCRLLKRYSMQELKDILKKVSKSKFLTGENNNGWKANYDWILKESNIIKIREGNFDSFSGSENLIDRNNNVNEEMFSL